MSDANSQPEPSMEEILASIRRIISEDDAPAEAAAPEPVEDKAAEEAEDVLELTEIVEETPAEPDPSLDAEELAMAKAMEEAEEEPETEEPEPEEAEPEEAEPEPEEETAEPVDLELREEDEEPEPEEPAPVAPAAPAVVDSDLIGQQPASQATASLSGLVAAVDAAHGGTPLGDGNLTIEDLVKEVMKPMIRQWLDQNLPGLVDRLVRREIERLSRTAEGD